MNSRAKQVVTSGLLVAIGLTLPIIFHSFAMGGPVFLPMHIPVLLGGFLLSPIYALLVGMLTPLLSSVLTGMPPFFPGAIQMMFELGVYSLVISLLYHRYKLGIYPSLLTSMLLGRFTAGIVNYILLTHFLAKAFSLKIYITAAFATALPGIIIQLIAIPALVKLLEHANILQHKKENAL